MTYQGDSYFEQLLYKTSWNCDRLPDTVIAKSSHVTSEIK